MTTLPVSPETVSRIRADLSEDRWTHTQGVMDLSRQLADVYSLPADDLVSAALFHDNARSLPLDDQRQLARQYHGELDELERQSPGLLHAPAGAQRMIDSFGFEPDDPLTEVVAAHTTGRENPEPLLSALLVADFAEPNRSHPSAKTVRSRIGEQSLRELTRDVIENKLLFLLNENRLIHPRSLRTYNSLCD